MYRHFWLVFVKIWIEFFFFFFFFFFQGIILVACYSELLLIICQIFVIIVYIILEGGVLLSTTKLLFKMASDFPPYMYTGYLPFDLIFFEWMLLLRQDPQNFLPESHEA